MYLILKAFLINILCHFAVGARVFARWTNGSYYRGFVSQSNSSTVSIVFDNTDRITFSKNDKSAVILDKIPNNVKIGLNVIGYPGNNVKFFNPGRILKSCQYGYEMIVTFADGNERCSLRNEIRIIP
jgi:hypothetical protein